MKKFNSCLLVDDEVDLLEAMRLGLEGIFEKIDTCEDGRTALEQLRTNHYDLIVSDIQMPHMRGDELLENLRIKGISTPFIFVTGNGSEVYKAEGRQLGVVEFFEKPFDLISFVQTIERVMEIAEMKKEFKSKI